MPIVVKTNSKKYISFDDNGNILSITQQPNNESYIEVNTSEILDLIKGLIPINQYRVEYDLVEKKYVLKHIDEWALARQSSSFLFRANSQNKNADVVLIQNNTKKRWELTLSDDVIDIIENNKINLQNAISGFSITEYKNPYALEYILNFDENNTIDKWHFYKDYPNDFVFDNKQLSVYTVKKFSDYRHEVIND